MIPAFYIIAALTNHGWIYQSDLGTFKTAQQCESHLGTQPLPWRDIPQKGTKICIWLELQSKHAVTPGVKGTAQP